MACVRRRMPQEQQKAGRYQHHQAQVQCCLTTMPTPAAPPDGPATPNHTTPGPFYSRGLLAD
jgi:hypothetical protein